MKSKIEISVVIPIFNEEECVQNLFDRVKAEMDLLRKSYEILLVDDGSTDHTRDILRKLAREHEELRVIFFRKNYGQTPAMVAGFDNAKGNIIITMDGDLQNDPADIKKLLQKMNEGYEIVSGWRYKRQDKLITRKIPSMIANKLISLLTGVHLHDYGCSLKAYKAECIQAINAYSEMHRFFPAVASITGARTAEIPVNHYARKFGKSKYGISRTFKVFADLFTIFMITKFSTRPGLLFAFLSIPFLITGSYLSFFSIDRYLFNQDPSIVWMGSALLVLSLGFHFLFLSILSSLILKRGKFKPENLCSLTAETL